MEIRQALDRLRSQCRGIAGNRGLSRGVHARHTAIQCGDQLLQRVRELVIAYRQSCAPPVAPSRRETFQISPQVLQRQ